MQNATYGDPRLPDRFWAKVYPCPITGCWLWGAGPFPNGYGCFKWQRVSRRAHRHLYLTLFGPIPEGLLVCHTCDVPLCVNPDHLFLGTVQDNADDMIRKGRNAPPTAGTTNAMATLDDQRVTEIFALRRMGWTHRRIADHFGTTRGNVGVILNSGTWAHLNLGENPLPDKATNKISDGDVVEIFRMRAHQRMTPLEIAEFYQVDPTHIRSILSGRRRAKASVAIRAELGPLPRWRR